jgi:hypothetical protein
MDKSPRGFASLAAVNSASRSEARSEAANVLTTRGCDCTYAAISFRGCSESDRSAI